MPLTDEARVRFTGHIGRWFDQHNVPSDLRTRVFDPKIKLQAVVKVRNDLIWWLRTRCWQAKKYRFGYPCGFLVNQEESGDKWEPLSYLNIAGVIGLSVSAVQGSLKRTRKKRRTMKLRAYGAPTEWDGIPVDVGGYIE